MSSSTAANKWREKAVAFGKFVWNHQEKKFCGRGGRSWAEIGVFYLIYYSALAGFFVACMAVFYHTLDSRGPRLTGDSSRLSSNPGMGFQPMPDVDYTLIRFTNKSLSYQPHVDSIKTFLKSYSAQTVKSTVNCSEVEPTSDQACRVDLAALTSDCNEENAFGFKVGQPCVLLRLNRIFDWVPMEYTQENINDSISDEGFREKILNDTKMIYIDCFGQNPGDVDNIGPVEYYPERGFRHHFYPFTNQKDYRSPLVFVKFLNLTRHVGVMVECRALAPNIYYDKTEKQGGLHFEILSDF